METFLFFLSICIYSEIGQFPYGNVPLLFLLRLIQPYNALSLQPIGIALNVHCIHDPAMPGVRRMSDPGPDGPPREYIVICREIDGLRSFLPQTHIPSASVWKRTFPFSQSAFLLHGSVSVWKRSFFGASKLLIQDSRESTSRSLRSSSIFVLPSNFMFV